MPNRSLPFGTLCPLLSLSLSLSLRRPQSHRLHRLQRLSSKPPVKRLHTSLCCPNSLPSSLPLFFCSLFHCFFLIFFMCFPPLSHSLLTLQFKPLTGFSPPCPNLGIWWIGNRGFLRYTSVCEFCGNFAIFPSWGFVEFEIQRLEKW